jgi:anti-sigma regulatory factor (Ser/Thr protein kinase)
MLFHMGSPERRHRGPSGVETFLLRLPAGMAAMSIVRQRMRVWLAKVRWPVAEQAAVLMTTSEACSNAVQHAYETGRVGDVEATARVVLGQDGRRVVVVVRDWGRWHRPTAEARCPGHGLRMIDCCTEAFEIRRSATGTTVTLTSRAVPHMAPTPEVPERPARSAAETARLTQTTLVWRRAVDLAAEASAATCRAQATMERARLLARRSRQLQATIVRARTEVIDAREHPVSTTSPRFTPGSVGTSTA